MSAVVPGDRVLVDVSMYVSGPRDRWCRVTRIAPGSAAFSRKLTLKTSGTSDHEGSL